jgi:hypothetical protein
MLPRLSRLRPLATVLVAGLGLCFPIESRAPLTSGEPLGSFSRLASEPSTLASVLGADRQAVSLHRIRAKVGALRSVDVDADGRPDLVATGSGRLRTFLNIGSGRFIEHAPTHTLLRHRTTPGINSRPRSAPTAPAALVVERHVLAPEPGTVEAELVGTLVIEVTASPLSLRSVDTTGSRAPPPSGES